MASNRIGRINEEIQRELAALLRTVKDPRVHGLVSITHVDTTPDLRYAKVFVSVLNQQDGKEVIRGLKSAGGYLRRELGHALQLRYTPSSPSSGTTPSTRALTSWICSAIPTWSSPPIPPTSTSIWTRSEYHERFHLHSGRRRLSP